MSRENQPGKGREGDERDALLTLARILVTAKTGRFVTKDAAAHELFGALSPSDRELMARARGSYLGEISDDWRDLSVEVADLARRLAHQALRELP